MSITGNCANARCGAELDTDHLIVLSTRHLRRFCSVECVTEGAEADLAITVAVAARDHNNWIARSEWAQAAR